LLVAWGTCARLARGVAELARARNRKTGVLQPLTLWPFPEARLRALAGQVREILVVEMNCGQMLEDVRLAAGGEAQIFFSGYPGGKVPSESEILKTIYKNTRRLSKIRTRRPE
jgi:2-oxoglutarate ferredoxin oxidoreductase subunit alpha